MNENGKQNMAKELTGQRNAAITNGVYLLQNGANSLYATVTPNGNLAVTDATAKADKNERNRWFRFTHLGGGQYSIRPMYQSDRVLTVRHIAKATYVVTADYAGYSDSMETIDARSRWTIESDGTIRNVHYASLVMASIFKAAKDDRNVYVETYEKTESNASRQRWLMQRLNDVAPEMLIHNKPAAAYIGTKVSAGIAEVSSEFAVDQRVSWKSSVEAVATVDANGFITPLTYGTTVISATSRRDPSVSASYLLTVEKKDTSLGKLLDTKPPKPDRNMFIGHFTKDYATHTAVTAPGYSVLGEVKYVMDFKTFLDEPTAYSENLCKVSSIASTLIHDNMGVDGRDICEWLEYHGMRSVELNPIMGSRYSETTFAIGFKPVLDKRNKTIVVAVVIHSANTVGEDVSNHENANDFRQQNDQIDLECTAKSLKSMVEVYVSQTLGNMVDDYGITYWITGQDRGGALADIVATQLIDEAERVFAYAFAASDATEIDLDNTSKGKYASVFNILA